MDTPGAIPMIDPYSVSLTAAERIHLLNLLPGEGKAVLLRRVDKLRTKLLFSDSEVKDWEIKVEGGNFFWSKDAATDTTVEVGESMWDEIRESLKAKNESGKLTLAELSLYDKFVEAAAPLGIEE